MYIKYKYNLNILFNIIICIIYVLCIDPTYKIYVYMYYVYIHLVINN